jgi:Bacterial Ig-like domain
VVGGERVERGPPVNTAALTPGTHTATVTVTDGAGNTSQVSWSMTIDSTQPAPPSITMNPTLNTRADVTSTVTDSHGDDEAEISSNTGWITYDQQVTAGTQMTAPHTLLLAGTTDSSGDCNTGYGVLSNSPFPARSEEHSLQRSTKSWEGLGR